MIVYPTWETTPSPQLIQQEPPKKKKKKKKIVSSSQQLPLFIDDYAIDNQLTSKLDKKISQFAKQALGNSHQKPFFSSFDLDEFLNSFKTITDYIPSEEESSVSEEFDTSIYYEAFQKAGALGINPGGTTTVTLDVTKEQIPPLIMELGPGIQLSDKEVAKAFGLPAKDLESISIEVIQDHQHALHLSTYYKVTIVRRNPNVDDLF